MDNVRELELRRTDLDGVRDRWRQISDKFVEKHWCFRSKHQGLSGEGMFEGNRVGMERQALVAFIFFAIAFIANHRMADIGEMHANLVLSAGQ